MLEVKKLEAVVPLDFFSEQVTASITLYVESLSATCPHQQNADRNMTMKEREIERER